MEITATCLLFCFVCLQITLLIALINSRLRKSKYYLDEQLPFISILIPARNESNNILACLQSINALDYPLNKLEVLVGNDDSTDDTETLILQFIDKKTQFKLINIKEKLGKAHAKANVLANLMQQSKGSIVFVTDADIAVKPSWIKALLPHFEDSKIGIVSGSTIVQSNHLFGQLQGMDWLYFSGLLVGFDYLGLKSTAVGNNMAFTREAYWATGGYENFDFSVTEDFKLFTEIRAKGYESINLMEYSSLNTSKPQNTFWQFLHQRKRWLIGAQQLPLIWKAIFALFASFYPLLIVLAIFNLKNALTLWLCKIVLQTVIQSFLAIRIKYKLHLMALILFELYTIFITFSNIIFFFLPIKMVWKQRTY